MKLGLSYFGNRMPHHFAERDLPELLETGATFVLHTLSEEDLQYYGGTVARMVAATKDAGLEVYLDPWGVAGVFGGEAYSRFLLDHPESWRETERGQRVAVACPNSPALWELMDRWMDSAAAMEPDVLFWDEPHFTSEEASSLEVCHCSVCRKLFEERYGMTMTKAGNAQLARFQEDSVVRFIDGLTQAGASRGLRNAVCLLPFDDERHGLQHWERIAALPGVDLLGVTPFWHLRKQDPREYVRRWGMKVRDLSAVHGKEPQVWLQAFLIDEGREPEILTAAMEVQAVGIRNVAAWGYRACEHMTALRPANPELTWRAVRDAFAALRI